MMLAVGMGVDVGVALAVGMMLGVGMGVGVGSPGTAASVQHRYGRLMSL
jgi:hypothetical protein